jgi:antitoxin component of MazEF toxin-antitoxin module
MIKKLTKYGNSHAILIDRAILELLNIQEGSLLKLKTDGTSLIITPVETSENPNISMTGEEKLKDVLEQRVKKMWDKTDPATLQKFIHSDNAMKAQEAFRNIFRKHAQTIEKLMSSTAFMHDLEELASKYKHNTSSDEYLKEFFELRYKHVPELRDMDKEMAIISAEIDKQTASQELVE